MLGQIILGKLLTTWFHEFINPNSKFDEKKWQQILANNGSW